jgi:hypothetical protein
MDKDAKSTQHLAGISAAMVGFFVVTVSAFAFGL